MSLLSKKEFVIERLNKRSFLADYTAPQRGQHVPIVLFVHGFKGFKDWGHFHLLAEQFALAGFAFFKFNLSHNGTTVDDPMNFADLEAFGNNNFSKELDDIDAMIDYIHHTAFDHFSVDLQRLFVIGHSRGGGVAIIKASEDERVQAVATWAALNNFKMGFTEKSIDHWRRDGVHYVDNARTRQKMPLYFQIYNDLMANEDRLNPKNAMSEMRKPTLLIHGNHDETVPLSHLYELAAANPAAKQHIVEGANHVFGGEHPYHSDELHPHTVEIIDKTISFFKNTAL